MGAFDRYTERPVTVDGTSFTVLTRRQKEEPPSAQAIVLHELPGATPALERFANELVAAGVEVHVPLLFGRRGEVGVVGMVRGAICLRRELSFFASGRSGRLAAWLRGLVDQLADEQSPDGDLPIGVVGMCMTGGIVLATMAHPRVTAVVASQPSLPLALPFSPHHVRADLGISAADRDASVASSTPVTCLRYRDDWRCPDERIDAITTSFGTSPVEHETSGRLTVSRYGRLTVIEVEGKAHAVLTRDRLPEAVDRVVTFLTGG